MSCYTSRTRIVTIITFSLVTCITRSAIRNWKVAPLPLSIIVGLKIATDCLQKSAINDATSGCEPMITITGYSFKGVDMARTMIMALLFESLVVDVVLIVLSLNLCGSAPHLI